MKPQFQSGLSGDNISFSICIAMTLFCASLISRLECRSVTALSSLVHPAQHQPGNRPSYFFDHGPLLVRNIPWLPSACI